MTTALWLLLGLAIGVGAERLFGRPKFLGPVGDGRVRAGRGQAPAVSARPRRRRRRLRLGLIITLALLVGLPVAAWLYANRAFDRIDKVEVGEALADGGPGTNYLLVGTDNRPGVEGNRSDTVLVLRIADGGAKMMSIPRDLWVTRPDGREGRINAAYNDGPETLIATVRSSLGIPVDRYAEINFVSFADLVDALGGVTIDFPNPASDPKSGLDVQSTGPVELDGAQALAYVRSRTYTETVDGRAVVDGTGDLGRVQRQQTFMRAVLAEAGRSRSPITLARIAGALAGGLKIDDRMSLPQALRFAWDMGKLDPETVVLPVSPTTISGAQVLLLQDAEAGPILAGFGA